MTKPFPVRCNDCTYSVFDKNSVSMLLCTHPKVNARDSWFLGTDSKVQGTSCVTERDRKGLLAPCGRRGKLWVKRDASILY